MLSYQVPHHAFPWLIFTAIWSVLPVAWHGPWWFVPLVVPLLWWRWKIQQQRFAMPGKLVRTVLMLGGVAAVALHYRTLLGQEAGVALLSLAFILKLLEMFRRRDAYVVLVLANFVLASACLFDRSPVTALYVFVGMGGLLAALININLDASHVTASSPARHAGRLIVQALPIMVLLFVFVPRFAPLWHMPADKNRAKTGMSDSISPGDVSQLSRSAELAFRVEFDGEVPPPAKRYWRGLTYSWYDGRRWLQAQPGHTDPQEYVSFYRHPPQRWAQQLTAALQAPEYRYRIILEPTGQQWLYALAVPELLSSNRDDIGLVRDYRLVTRQPIETPVSYDVRSGRLPPGFDTLSPREQQHLLHLPRSSNPQAQQWGRELRQRFADDAALINYVLGWYRSNPFYYTLSPPLYGTHGVDEFLFEGRRGFCEHYASSMAVVLRAAGIPTRLVGGYQGGRLNSVGTHLLIHQYDAHAWIEAWLPEQGWVEIDPTAAVAPERVEFGLEEALSGRGERLFTGISRLTQSAWLQAVRHWADYMDFAWSKWVLGYDQQRQLDVLKKLLGDVSLARVALVLTVSLSGVVGAIWLVLWWTSRPSPLPPGHREFRAMAQFARRRGVSVPANPSVRQLGDCLLQAWPSQDERVQCWVQQLEQQLYGEADSDGAQQLRRQGQQLRKNLRRA